jgi:predicted RNA-binding Zn-ribbon protein involved in translation (DUF1610 family)
MNDIQLPTEEAMDDYCPACDEPMEAWTPKPDGSKRWVCDNCGVWSDPPPVDATNGPPRLTR